MKCYATGHMISNMIMAAFAEGFDGQIVPPARLLDGPAAMYGILRGTGELIHRCRWIRRDYWYVDHGYFRRSKTATSFDGFYRVTRNGLQNTAPAHAPDDRWRALGLSCRPWRRDGRAVLVIPLTEAVGHFHAIDVKQWEASVVEEVNHHTNRPIRIKYKHEGDLQEELKDVWCVVCHSSNTAMVALMNGIPVITLGESAASPLSWGFENIESPEWREREPLFHHLAYQQFTLSEIRDGTARKLLNE